MIISWVVVSHQGVTISAEAPFQRAAKLPRIDKRPRSSHLRIPYPSAAGMFGGYVGQVEGLVSRRKASKWVIM